MAITILAGCAADPSPPSTLFVTDRDAGAIVRYDGATGAFVDVFASGVDRPSSVRLGPDGQLYVAGFGRGEVLRYDVATGARGDVFFWDTRVLEEPVELLFDDANLVVLGNDTRNAVVIDAAGAPIDDIGYPSMRAAHDFAFAPDGLLYVATEMHPELGSAIQVWDVASGAMLRHFGGSDAIGGAIAVMIDDAGIVHACDYDRGQIVRFDPATGASLGVLAGGLDKPVSLDIGPDGALHVLDAGGIHRVDVETGERLSTLVRADDGHLDGPRSFTFVVD